MPKIPNSLICGGEIITLHDGPRERDRCLNCPLPPDMCFGNASCTQMSGRSDFILKGHSAVKDVNVEKVMKLRASGLNPKVIGKIVGLRPDTVRKIIDREVHHA